MSFFSTPSPLERRIELCTSESIAEPPLQTYLEIAEDISRSSDGGAAHLKAMRRRLASKSSHVHFLTLSLLDVCVKNGRDSFHETVSNPEFLSSLSSLATTSKQRHVREQALSLIQQWAKAFPAQGLHSFTDCYVRLRNRGVVFPDDKEGGVVFTPPVNLSVVAQRQVPATGGRSAPDRSPNRSPNRSPGRSPGRSPHREEKEETLPSAELEALSWASPQYIARIKAESLQVVEYLTLFQQLIASSPASSAALRGNESVQTLHATIHDCRQRVSRLLVELEDETLMDLMIHVSELIRVSVDFYNARLKGDTQAREPQLDLPAVLRQQPTSTTSAATAERKEQKEGKETEAAAAAAAGGGSADGKAGEAEDPFAQLAQRNDRKQQNPSSPQPPVAAVGDLSLSQFDPLA